MKAYYEDDACTIYHGDCREVLPGLGKVDLVLTDPPYGMGVDRVMAAQSGQQHGRALAAKRVYVATGWDDCSLDQQIIDQVIGLGKYAIVFGGNYYALPPVASWLVWDKENGSNGFADVELAWTNLPQAARLRRHLWNGMMRKGAEQRDHPTQKPLELMAWCVAQADKHRRADTILDPFMGSGTTLRAAKDLGRKAIGIEIEERYCEMAAKRLAQEVLAL